MKFRSGDPFPDPDFGQPRKNPAPTTMVVSYDGKVIVQAPVDSIHQSWVCNANQEIVGTTKPAKRPYTVPVNAWVTLLDGDGVRLLYCRMSHPIPLNVGKGSTLRLAVNANLG